ncbi:MAG: Gfo/Idh/MocA family oxidoreductase [Blautia sp.]|nr:Gfo/Idh/MocA family oxidoreductase [Blautia sp.]
MKLRIALVGAGWAGDMHARSYAHVYGVDIELHTACALEPSLPDFAKRFGFLHYTSSFQEVLDNPEIDVVDIASPPNVHKEMIISALQAGKHVVCEKPLVGYFGIPGEDPERVGDVSKEKMLSNIRADIEEIESVVRASDRYFFYAENWVYAPSFQRACDLIVKKGTTVAFMQGMAAHKGSHAAYVSTWAKSGGGCALRNMIHPVSAALFLKRRERESKGLPYGVSSIYCDCSQVTAGIDKGHILASPVDVEDFSHMVITFIDGTKAVITSNDLCLGGIRNQFDIYGNDSTYSCHLSPVGILDAYFADERGIEEEAIQEKNDHNLGYMQPLIADELMRGYYGEIQDFMEYLRDGRRPISGFDLAKECMEIISLGYCAAEQQRVMLL